MNAYGKERRQLVRTAVKIHEQLVGPARSANLDDLPTGLWEETAKTVARLRIAQRRGWRAAGHHLNLDLDYVLQRLVRELGEFRLRLPQTPRHDSIATPGEIAADLAALAEEFEECQLDLSDKVIRVRTAPIVLEGCALGSFRVVLKWERIGQQKPYEVIADDPNPPDDESDVTHPHVRGKLLCEGDGAAAIKAALRSGRLLDFFVLVRQVLQTYNPDSAHVRLSHWGGVACRDCGWQMGSDEESNCDRCARALCSDCVSLCQGCDCYLCAGCAGECSECGERYCEPCLTTVAGSSQSICPSCLQKKEEADDAREEAPPSQPVETPLTATPDAANSPDPVRVGETAAPARSRTNRGRRVRRVSTRRPAARRGRASGAAAVQRRNR